MFERLGQLLGKAKQKAEQQPPEESGGSVLADKSGRQATSDSLRSLLKTAIADAEEIVASIKTRAQVEAEAEAARIIGQAKLEVQEIKDQAEKAAREEAEELLSTANRKAEITEIEAKQKALQYLIKAGEALISTSQAAVAPVEASATKGTELRPDAVRQEKAEEPVRLEEEVVEEKVAEPVRLEEEVVEEKTEEQVQLEEEVVEEKVAEPVRLEEEVVEKPSPIKLDSQALYTGEVELVITAPVELKLVSRLYNYLQKVPDLRILYTRGSWDRGTAITVVLEKALPLVRVLSETPGVKVTPELLEGGNQAMGKSSFLTRGGETNTRSLKLLLQEA